MKLQPGNSRQLALGGLLDPDADSEEPPSTRAPHSRGPLLGRRSPAARLPASLVEAQPIFEGAIYDGPLTYRVWPAAPRRRRRALPRDPSQAEVVVLHSTAESIDRGSPLDLVAEAEAALVAEHIANALSGLVRSVDLVPVWDDIHQALSPFDPRRHVIVNICEGLGGRAFTEPEAARQIARLGFLHTGASHEALLRCNSKLFTKKLFEAVGLHTPRYQVVRQPAGWAPAVPLPAIIKPAGEGGSLGITQASLVTDLAGLQARVAECFALYRQPVLIEEYIPGREINVALWGNLKPEILPISEICFEWTDDPLQQFVTYESKWLPESVEYHGTPGVCPAALNSEEQRCVERAARKAFGLLGLTGPARVDMRLRDGQPYLLEVNANPDLAPDAGFFRSASTAGYSYPAMIMHILQLALDSGA
jgi:D-alanine-D-alanine ligase